MARLTPKVTGIKFDPDSKQKFMINIKTGMVFPYNAFLMSQNSALRTWAPNIKKLDTVPEVEEIEVEDNGEVGENIEIEEVIVEPKLDGVLPEAPFVAEPEPELVLATPAVEEKKETPLEKARRVKAEKVKKQG